MHLNIVTSTQEYIPPAPHTRHSYRLMSDPHRGETRAAVPAGRHPEVAEEEVRCVKKMLGRGANVIKMIKWNEEISKRLRLPVR